MSYIRKLITRILGVDRTDLIASWRHQWREENHMAYLHREGVRRIATLDQTRPHRLHLGCGHVYKQDWLNIDSYYQAPCTPDITLNLRKGLPFADASCAEIYSEHFFEHIPYPEGAVKNLSESFRVLKPGGLLSIGVPDATPVLKAYLTGTETGYYAYFNSHFSVRRHLGTSMEAINWLFRQGGEHHFIYDYETLSMLLAKAGFASIVQREWDESRDSPPRREDTIYIDCQKPLAP